MAKAKTVYKSAEGIDEKIQRYLDKIKKSKGAITLAGISRALNVTPKTFKEYALGLAPNITPEVHHKFQDIYLMNQEFLEEACLGVRGGKGAVGGAKFLLSNHHGMSEKASVEMDGGLAIYKKIEEDSQRIVDEVSDELEKEIKKTLKEKAGK